jgi:hypothetical protein
MIKSPGWELAGDFMMKSAWILIATLLLSGCASSGSVRQTQAIGTNKI